MLPLLGDNKPQALLVSQVRRELRVPKVRDIFGAVLLDLSDCMKVFRHRSLGALCFDPLAPACGLGDPSLGGCKARSGKSLCALTLLEALADGVGRLLDDGACDAT